MKAKDDDRHNHHVGEADHQQEYGKTVAEVSIDDALSLILDVNGCHVQERKLGTIDGCQDRVPKGVVETLLEKLLGLISSFTGKITSSMPAL